ncbi:MAG: extracellular solute-binding protein [Oscillospiraceae bacterium]
MKTSKIITRILTTLLAAAMVVGGMASCKKGPTGKTKLEGVTVKIASPFEKKLEPGLSDANDRYIERLAKTQEELGVTVEHKLINAGEYWDGMVVSCMSGEPYGDLLVGPAWYVCDWIKGNALRDVAPLAKELGIDFNDGTWSKICLEDMTYGSKIYGFDRSPRTLQYGLLYNTRLFKEAELKDPNVLIAEGGKWDLNTFSEYARKLTKKSASGRVSQYGFASTNISLSMGGMVMANGGKLIDYTQTPPKLGMQEEKALEAINLFERMVNTDKSINTRWGWDEAYQALVAGTVGMVQCEEWCVEFMRDYIEEKGSTPEYALTQFPNSEGVDYIDPAVCSSGNTFIPTGASDAQAKAALQVYASLYLPDDTKTVEETARARGEELFIDEASVAVYTDIISKNRIKSEMLAKIGLDEIYKGLVLAITEGQDTPKAILDAKYPQMETMIQDSAYMAEMSK